MKKIRLFSSVFLVLLLGVPSAMTLRAEGQAGLSAGQAIYVPAYSHIYSGNREMPFFLTVTLSIRNIDPRNPIRIKAADYFETQGKLLKK